MQERIFKSYDIRGIYPEELNEETIKKIVPAFVTFLSQKLNKKPAEMSIVIGWDMRIGNDELTKQAFEEFMRLGVKITKVGLVPIDFIYFVTGKYDFDGGIMFTASHNPKEYVGIKMVSQGVVPISGRELFGIVKSETFITASTQGTIEAKDYWLDYLKHIWSFVDAKDIKPLKIVIDAGNGMAGKVIPQLLKDTNLQVEPLFYELDGNFPNRPSNPITEGAADSCSQKVLETKADFGVMFDGDTDRMFLIDDKGAMVRGDMTLLLLAKSVLKETSQAGIVYNLICSKAVPELITKWGGKAIRSEVGYSNLARHMKEEDGIISGEVSGHYAFAKNYFADSGFIALLMVLKTISADGRKLSETMKEYRLYHRADEMNLTVSDTDKVLQKFREKYKDNIRDELDGITIEFWHEDGSLDWWFNVRPSNTEPLLRITVETVKEEDLAKRQKELNEFVNQVK